MRTSLVLLLITCIVWFCTSCTSTKDIAYFQGKDTSYSIILDTIEAPIQKNDILSITVTSLNTAASADFNLKGEALKGYLVNNDGNIIMPVLGNVVAAGLTKSQLKKNITQSILDKQLLLSPLVDVRHMNFEVTVLGEVSHPTVITVPSEQISLLKALGLAGDLTIYGKRTNVLLVREENGRRTTNHIDLTSADFLSSPYYYLKPNDLVYVEPSKSKVVTTSRSLVLLPILLSTVSLLIITYATFK
jgi:polysaccharide export outer membrane protein